jgi:hypothetical protein
MLQRDYGAGERLVEFHKKANKNNFNMFCTVKTLVLDE